MIYTCYEMVRDCRAGKAEGWTYFLSNYVPVVRKLLTRYADGDVSVEHILIALHQPGSNLFTSAEPAPERWFVAELRQEVIAQVPFRPPEIGVDLETAGAALEPLTVVEKQAAWLETMRYTPQETGAMLRMAPATVEKIRARAADLIRGKVNAWRSTLLVENGFALGREAGAAQGSDCLPAKTFLDVLDGRTTWRGREVMENHVRGCWHCIDHFCRLVEVLGLLRGMEPLTPDEAARFSALLGIAQPKAPVWKRWTGGA